MTKKRRMTLLALLGAVVLLAAVMLFFYIREEQSYPLRYTETVEKYAVEYSLDPAILYAVIRAESSFEPDARSASGACGLMQLMPATFEEIAWRLGEDSTVLDIFDPETNIRYGTFYLAYLYRQFGNETCMLAAYNAGMGRVSSWLSDSRYSDDRQTLTDIPYPETKNYVEKVSSAKEKYLKLLRN